MKIISFSFVANCYKVLL